MIILVGTRWISCLLHHRKKHKNTQHKHKTWAFLLVTKNTESIIKSTGLSTNQSCLINQKRLHSSQKVLQQLQPITMVKIKHKRSRSLSPFGEKKNEVKGTYSKVTLCIITWSVNKKVKVTILRCQCKYNIGSRLYLKPILHKTCESTWPWSK